MSSDIGYVYSCVQHKRPLLIINQCIKDSWVQEIKNKHSIGTQFKEKALKLIRVEQNITSHVSTVHDIYTISP